jgi:hypothetical protein
MKKKPLKPLRIPLSHIAIATGKSLHAVRKARERRKFDPRDLQSVASYIATATKAPKDKNV